MVTCYSNWAHHHLAQSASGAYLFVVNHKAACSTALRTLWAYEAVAGDLAPPPIDQDSLHLALHQRALGPWRRWSLDAPLAPVRFSVARNPYARIASCYLDKMRRPSPQRRFFAHNAGLDPAADFGFREFLERLAEMPRALDDTHWARQSFNTGAGLMDLTHIAKVETLDEDLSAIMAAIAGGPAGVAVARPHATGAAGRLRALYGPREIELVDRIYASDFALFAYRPGDLDDLAGEPVDPAAIPRRPDADAVLSLVSAAAELQAGAGACARGRLGALVEERDELLRRNAMFLLAMASPWRERIDLLERLLEDGATDPVVAKELAAAIAERGRAKRARALLEQAAAAPVSAGYFHRHRAAASDLLARL